MKPTYHVQMLKTNKMYEGWETFHDGITTNKKQAIRWTINARKNYSKVPTVKIRLVEIYQRTIPVSRFK